MIRYLLKFIILTFILSTIFLSSCDEDFDLITEYTDQTVVYAFLEHKDPWNENTDTNWVVVNKAFLGEENVDDMAAVSDSVNYSNYDEIEVSLQRIKSLDPNSGPVEEGVFNHEPIILKYTTHYKDSGIFATDNNVVFYTTKALMYNKDMSFDPSPDLIDYYYKLSVKKPNKEEVYATTKMIRGITNGNKPATKYINMASSFPGYTYKIEFESNMDARLYFFRIRMYYYEKRTDGNVYLDYTDYEHPILITKYKIQTEPQSMTVSIAPLSFFAQIANRLQDTNEVVWRVPKTSGHTGLAETHQFLYTLGSQETYVYNQVTQPSDGIVQEKPTYSNITNGVGLFTSSWNYVRDGFVLTDQTVDSLAMGEASKDLKFLNNHYTTKINDTITAGDVIKRY